MMRTVHVHLLPMRSCEFVVCEGDGFRLSRSLGVRSCDSKHCFVKVAFWMTRLELGLGSGLGLGLGLGVGLGFMFGLGSGLGEVCLDWESSRAPQMLSLAPSLH